MESCEGGKRSVGRREQDIPLSLNADFVAGGHSLLSMDPLFSVDDGMYRYLHYIDINIDLHRVTADTTGSAPGRLAAEIVEGFTMKCKGFALYNDVSGQRIQVLYRSRAGRNASPLPLDLADNETDVAVLTIRVPFADPATGGDDTAIPVPWLQKTARIDWGEAADLGTGVTVTGTQVIEIVAHVEDSYEARTPRAWTIESQTQTTNTPVLPKGDYRVALIFDASEDISSTEVDTVDVPGVFEFPVTGISLVARWNGDYAESDGDAQDPAAAEFIPVLFLPYPKRWQSNTDCVGTPDAGLSFKISGSNGSPEILTWYYLPSNRRDREMEFRKAYPYIDVDKDTGSHVLKPKTRSGKLLSLDDRAALNLAWKAKAKATAARDTAATKAIKG